MGDFEHEYKHDHDHGHGHEHEHEHEPEPSIHSSPTSHDSHDIEALEAPPTHNEQDFYYRQSLTRHPSTILEKTSTANSTATGFGEFDRAQNIISRIRSRDPGQTAAFTHPLAQVKTAEDVLVGFDGPDDPYMPLNWPFKKKVITTLLYGFTTMGMF